VTEAKLNQRSSNTEAQTQKLKYSSLTNTDTVAYRMPKANEPKSAQTLDSRVAIAFDLELNVSAFFVEEFFYGKTRTI
jgi:hypothetical protein